MLFFICRYFENPTSGYFTFVPRWTRNGYYSKYPLFEKSIVVISIHVLMGISPGYIPQHGQTLLIHTALPRVRLVGRVLPSHDTVDLERDGLTF